MRIAVDAMGGDHAPRSIIDGALAAARHLDLGLLLAGPETIVRDELARHPDHQQLDIRIIDAPDVVDGNLVSCRGWPDMPQFGRAMMELFAKSVTSVPV